MKKPPPHDEVLEARAIAQHAEDEGDSELEVSLYRELGAALHYGSLGAPAPETWSPSEQLLLQVRRAPATVDPEERARVEAWFEAHPGERDAFEAFRSLAATSPVSQAIPSVLARFAERISEVLAPITRPALAPAALVILLAVGLLFSRDLFGRESLLRGGENPGGQPTRMQPGGAFELTLVPDEVFSVPRGSLPGEGRVRLKLVLADPHPGGSVTVDLRRSDGVALRELASVEPGAQHVVVDLDATWLAGASSLEIGLGSTVFTLRLE